jgi:hypothetical protein
VSVTRNTSVEMTSNGYQPLTLAELREFVAACGELPGEMPVLGETAYGTPLLRETVITSIRATTTPSRGQCFEPRCYADATRAINGLAYCADHEPEPVDQTAEAEAVA